VKLMQNCDRLLSASATQC